MATNKNLCTNSNKSILSLNEPFVFALGAKVHDPPRPLCVDAGVLLP